MKEIEAGSLPDLAQRILDGIVGTLDRIGPAEPGVVLIFGSGADLAVYAASPMAAYVAQRFGGMVQSVVVPDIERAGIAAASVSQATGGAPAFEIKNDGLFDNLRRFVPANVAIACGVRHIMVCAQRHFCSPERMAEFRAAVAQDSDEAECRASLPAAWLQAAASVADAIAGESGGAGRLYLAGAAGQYGVGPLELTFKEAGYRILRPAEMDLAALATEVARAAELVVSDDAQSMYAQFLPRHAKCVFLGAGHFAHAAALTGLRALDAIHVEADVQMLPGANGPRLLGPTCWLLDFLKAHGVPYDLKALTEGLPADMVKYLAAWSAGNREAQDALPLSAVAASLQQGLDHTVLATGKPNGPLVYRRAAQVNYKTDHDFAMFCKTYHGDLHRVQILVESFHQHNVDNIPLYISCPAAEYALFAPLAGKNIEVITDESYGREFFSSVGLAGMTPGYLNQQICKLTFYRTGLAANYLTLDSDCVFIRDFHVSDFMHDEGVPYTVLVMDKDLSIEKHYRPVHWIDRQKMIGQIYAAMGVDDRRLRTCHGAQVLNIHVLDSLKNDFMDQRGLIYPKMLEMAGYEFTWYNVWLQKTRLVPEFAVEPFFKILHMRPDYILSRLKNLTQADYADAYVGIVMNSKWRPATPLHYEDPAPDHVAFYNEMMADEEFIHRLGLTSPPA